MYAIVLLLWDHFCGFRVWCVLCRVRLSFSTLCFTSVALLY